MVWKFDGFNWLVRLEKGEELIKTITDFANEQKIAGAWINVIGGASSAELGFYDLANKTYKWKNFDEMLEIVSLQGNLAYIEGRPILHLHGVLGGADYSIIGGHVKELIAAATCEVYIHRWYGSQLTRTLDDEVGLPLLDL